MISEEEFQERFNDLGLSAKDLGEFYNSIIESITYRLAGSILFFLLLKTAEKVQWPILQRMDNLKLKAYQDAEDKDLVKEFVLGIKLEKKARKEKSIKFTWFGKKHHSFIALRYLLLRRTEIYEKMFDFNEEDIKACEERAQELRRNFNLKKRRQ